ncbi:MAG: glucose-6-phosphate isomerase [Acidobacteriota bacterium]
MQQDATWERFNRYHCCIPELDLTLNVSRMGFPDDFVASMVAPLELAFKAMDDLERGAIANPDEQRMVGHYWLRNPNLAPYSELTYEIQRVYQQVKSFAADVHAGRIKPPNGSLFRKVLSIGIGGSALGPMFVADALGEVGKDLTEVSFIDNTDPDGIGRTLSQLAGSLGETLCIVTSKSGGTPETRNGMLVVAEAYRQAGLDFPAHAVAITMPDSRLDKLANAQGWLSRFAIFDWIGGRTSELSAVGLLPAALQGLDIDAMLEGAALCDEATRKHDGLTNPAALLALAWFHATGGRGLKDMVVLPYKDRLLLISRYLQQLVMESLGKRLDVAGNRVDQGISVYGNKGSTDQHAYVQQLRDGINNFFATFVRVLETGGSDFEVEPGVGCGDYLHGLLLGTRAALWENERQSLTITVARVDARSIGALIALFERAVGLYASLVGINAYHQPGVEAGKKAAADVLALQIKAQAALSPTPSTAEVIARMINEADQIEAVYLILEHLAANNRARILSNDSPLSATFASV